MKQSTSFLLATALCMAVGTSAFAQIEWTGANSSDFTDSGNWASAPANGSNLYINTNSPNSPVISTDLDLSFQPGDLWMATSAGSTGELEITTGANVIVGNRMRIGLSTSPTATLTISGGHIEVNNSYTTIGNSSDGNANVTVNMSDGYWKFNRLTLAQTLNDTVTFNMSGGELDANDGAGSNGYIRMGPGNNEINLSGTAVINVERMRMTEAGVLNMNGGTFNISAPDGIAFDFEADVSTMLAQIVYNSGDFNVTGDYATLLNDAVAQGSITTDVAGQTVLATYDGSTTTTLSLVPIPEPASIALLGMGAVALLRRRK